MDRETKQLVGGVTGFIVTALIGSNLFFVKRLVDKVDDTRQMVIDLRVQVAVIDAKLESQFGKNACTEQDPDFGEEIVPVELPLTCI